MASVSRVSVQLPVGKVSITDDYTGESFQEFPRMFCFPALLVFIKEKESIPFPFKPFDAVAASSAEQEEDIFFV